MRLWYQSFARHDAFGGYARALRGVLDRVADPGTEIEIHGLKRGGVHNYYRRLELLDTHEVVENAILAQRRGFDAVLIGNVADPGLREAREALTIPVLGLCETALHLACIMGAGYSFVTIADKFDPRVVENAERCGLRGRLVSVERMGMPDYARLELAFAQPAERDDLIARFAAAARAAVAKGAEVVVPAGGVVMAFLAREGVHEIEGARVLNGVVALVKLAEAAVKLQALTGGFISKRLAYASPPEPLRAAIRAAYGDDVYPQPDRGPE